MPQLILNSPMAKAFPGMLADAGDDKVVYSVVNVDTVEIRPGIMVAKGAEPDDALLLTASNQVVKGIVLRAHTFAQPEEYGDVGIKPKTDFGVLGSGRAWVIVEGTLPVEGNQVHVRAVATGLQISGAFRALKDATTTIDVTPFCRWTGRTGVAPDGVTNIAELQISIVNRSLALADI